jgi:ARG/rhodanese/phosphatase superfamily protein
MRSRLFATLITMFAATALLCLQLRRVQAGQEASASDYTVLEPIRNGSLTVFPVAASRSYATGQFLTLDEGFRSGEVVVTEYGNTRGLVRRNVASAVQQDSAEVNRLVLINNSKRPLLLLAGEIVAGGKQDRVIGKDRIVPAESDPVDLSVFCVEPGRWVASSAHFGSSGATYGSSRGVTGASGGGVAGGVLGGTLMAQPSVRAKAMGDKDQSQVWAEVRKQQQSMATEVTGASSSLPGSADLLRSTSSYAVVMEDKDVKEKVDEVAKPIEQNYQSLIKQLRDRKAVGVVVAVNGRIIWSDTFASTELLEKYWPKLVRSYASEAVAKRVRGREATLAQAQAFLADMGGRKETIESEPGIYRQTEVNGDGFKAFALTSLLPKTGFDVHVAKMAE